VSIPGNIVEIAGVQAGHGRPLYIIAGPCVLEDPDEMLHTAEFLARTCRDLQLGYCFKSSYTKDNRTSGSSYRGPGPEEGLHLLEKIGQAVGAPVLTDIHHPAEAAAAAEVVEILQIPAFMCRQSSLLEAAAATGKVVNVKKGQFLAPEDMRHVVGKLADSGARRVLLTERGAFFGYRDLVVDYRSIAAMRGLGLPVVFDATHSVQTPGSTGTTTGGRPELVPLLARCGLAAGADIIFLEVHPDPARAMSDSGSQLPLEAFAPLVRDLAAWRNLYLEQEGLTS